MSCVWILHTSAAFRIHRASLPERPSFSSPTCKFISGLFLPSSLFDRRHFMTSFLAPCHFCIVARPYSGGGDLLLWSTVPLDHATFAWQDTFLQAAANFLLDPQYPQVLFFGFWRRSADRFRTLRPFLGPPTDVPAASPLGISWCSTIDWIGFSLCHFLAGGLLFLAILQVCQSCINYESHLCLAKI
jgi:hypothetical protein